jgi:hypothetical protein
MRLEIASLALCSALLAGCSSLPAPAPINYLDERTGITLTVVDEPIVLARERRDLAANAREYLTLVAATRNQSGRITPVLLVHRWSTIDERVLPLTTPPPESLVIVADGRDLRPTPLKTLPKELSAATDKLWHPQVSRVTSAAYSTDGAQLRWLADSKRLSAFFEAPGEALPYLVWRDGRGALQRFAQEAVTP